MSSPSKAQREIRAKYDDHTITVYQAYNSAIASAAVREQRLDAAQEFKLTRMTWIKPSWCWVNYRAGYSYKDPGQERILALKIPHAYFLDILLNSTLSTEHGGTASTAKDPTSARIQWDPERDYKIDRLDYRSIQIGIPAAKTKEWVRDGIVGIEDVTDRARELKRVVDEEKDINEEDLISRGLLVEERVYEVPAEVRKVLKMDMA